MTEVNARLIAINLLFKFEVSSFIRSKDMTGDPKCRNGPLDFDHAHTRTVSHHMVNSCTKIKVFSFGRSRDIPGVFKIVKWSRDHDHAPFRDDFSSAGWDLLRPTYMPNSKSLSVTLTNI